MASVVSVSLRQRGRQGDERNQIFQIVLVFPNGRLLPLTEAGHKQRDKAVSMIAEATGLDILSVKQK
jgi:hypothetical protein